MPEEKKEILVFGQIYYAQDLYARMKENYTMREFTETREAFLDSSDETSYDNVVGVLLARGADQIITKVDHEIINILSLAVTAIIVMGEASKLVDLKAATDNGIFVADTQNDPKMESPEVPNTDEWEEILALENLDFALVLGVPKNVLNNFDDAAERAAERAGEIVAGGAEGYELDVTDIEIQI
ncbi:3441_t:CDS:2 [Paraglomus occultum]|uniref:3441_t:CDS:1 n=1 Tax=Paraglomus occultum TaxID=144539 RepID=A0A9N9BY89_9GLOM|nr:3441_t:CDS:2 [Paraglomus occultum]